jgi:hypothetical protein
MRSFFRLSLAAGLLMAGVSAVASTVPAPNTPAPATQDAASSLVAYRIDVTRPNEPVASATLLTADNVPVDFDLTQAISYIQQACLATRNPAPKVEPKPATDISFPISTVSNGAADACTVSPDMPVGTQKMVFTPGVITTGVQLTLTRHGAEGDVGENLRIKVSNTRLLALRTETQEGFSIQLPDTDTKASDQVYPVIPNTSLVLDLGHGAQVSITRVPNDSANTVSSDNPFVQTSLRSRVSDNVQIEGISRAQGQESARCNSGTLIGGGYALTSLTDGTHNAPDQSFPQGQSWVVSDDTLLTNFTPYAVCDTH